MGKSILIADADQQTASLLTSTLEARKHRVERVQDGHTAIEKVRALPPDMIIVGEQLDDIDGIGFIAKLRAASRSAKVVFVSNQWRDAELYQMLTKDYGVSLVLHRPLKPLLAGAQLESLLSIVKVGGLDSAKEHEKKAVEALRIRFREGLAARISAIQQNLESAREIRPDLEEAMRLAHNLKGTASTCSSNLIYESSMALEKHLAAMRKMDNIEESTWSMAASLFERVRESALSELDNDGPQGPQVEDDSAKAKVLFVAEGDHLEAEKNLNSGGLPVKFIASSPSEAKEKAANNSLDAVLIDIGGSLNQTSPVTLARELRSMTGNESLPLGFIKSRTEALDRIDVTHAGASLFLDMPLEPGALRDGVEYLLGVRQGGRPRVLVVDDDPDFSSLIVNTLGREGMLVRSINDPTLAVETMDAFVPDLVLLDVMMPVVSGFDVCRLLRANTRWQDTPILFLTAETELEARLAAFDAGGDDYLPKPVATVELLTRVKVRLERARLMRERADKDVLSGLLLRRAFMEQVSALVAEAARHSFMFTLALLDVDKFKNINDTYGHLAGDRVLAHLGQLLKQRFRVEDIRGRWGGEEFIVALRHESTRTTQGALQRLLEELREMPFTGDHGETFNVTFTAGLSSFPTDGDCLEKLVHAADARLYAGKEAGRNRIMVSDRGGDGDGKNSSS